MAQEQRRLAAIMFTDMVGYTALTQANESRAMDLLAKHNDLLRPIFTRFKGREVKSIGDSFLVEFDSALDALRCAVEMQSRIHDYNLKAAEGEIRIRIGIHLGDVIHRDGDDFGDAVNISSRIEPLADPDGICVTRQVYDQVHNKFDLPLVSMGSMTLKNVEEPVEVYRVQMPWTQMARSSAADSRRVAVLPFANMSPDPADEYFADGMTDELISTVSRIDGTEVISRTSVMLYKRSPKPIRQISSELDAGTVLEGSIRKAGNRLRVTVQLIDAVRDRHLWAESYDRNMDDVFAIQSDIAGRVADALRTRMVKERRGSQGDTDNVMAYTAYLRAKELGRGGGEARIKESIALLESAVAEDPSFSRAYAELARTLRHMGMYGDYSALMAKAEDAARKAIETGPECAEAHASMAAVHVALDRFQGAQEELESAIRLNPNLSDAHALLGEVNGAFGRLDEAVRNYRRAYALDPVSLHSAVLLASVLRVSGSVEEALQIFSRMDELYPNNSHVHLGKSGCYVQLNDYENAREQLVSGLASNPEENDLKIGMGVLNALEGRRALALEDLRTLSAAPGTASANARMLICAALGEYDEAFSALDDLARIHAWPFLIKAEPLLKGMRADPRFTDFCRRVGLPPD